MNAAFDRIRIPVLALGVNRANFPCAGVPSVACRHEQIFISVQIHI